MQKKKEITEKDKIIADLYFRLEGILEIMKNQLLYQPDEPTKKRNKKPVKK